MKGLILCLFVLSSLVGKTSEYLFFIQVLSVKELDRTLGYVEKLQDKEYAFEVIKRNVSGSAYNKVLVGPYDTKKGANKDLSDLKKLLKNKTIYVTRYAKSSFREQVNYEAIQKYKTQSYVAYKKRDFKKMNSSIEEAALLGDKDSIYYIGKNYHNGIGLEQDLEKAQKWYKECTTYDSRCSEGLGDLYIDTTLTIRPDLKKAFAYYNQAAVLGSKRAKSIVENRDNIIKYDQMKRADKVSNNLVKHFLFQYIKNSSIQRIVIDKVEEDATHQFSLIHFTFLLNKKVKYSTLTLERNQFDYWKSINFQLN